jgi:hypothetical protein
MIFLQDPVVTPVTVKDPGLLHTELQNSNLGNDLAAFLDSLYRIDPYGPRALDKPEITRLLLGSILDRAGKAAGTPTPGIDGILGYGHHGTAYRLSNGTVLKVSDDTDEFKVMSILRNINHPNLVRVYDTFILYLRARDSYVYKIKFIQKDFAGQTLRNMPQFHDIDLFLNEIGSEAEQRVGYHKDAMKWQITAFRKAYRVLSGDEKTVMGGILAAAEALYKAKIYTIDIHGANIGMQGLKPILFDFGSGDTEAYPKVPADILIFDDPASTMDLVRDWAQAGFLA